MALKVICIELITQMYRSVLYLQSEQTGTRWMRWLSDQSRYNHCSILRKLLTCFLVLFMFLFLVFLGLVLVVVVVVVLVVVFSLSSSPVVMYLAVKLSSVFQLTIETDKGKKD